MRRSYFGIFVVVALSFFAIQPFFTAGFFPIHDDTQVVRVAQMSQAISDGHFPVRWVKDLGYGYGYPIFNFYAPFAYYAGSLVSLLGMNALDSTKMMMILGVLFAGVSMYYLAREFWGEVGGIVSGLFYMYAPYHALDIYVRGAVAEFWAYGFLPLVVLGMYKIFKEPSVRWVVLNALAFAGIILSHNLTAMMVVPFMSIVILLHCYIAYRDRNLVTIRYTLYAIFLGLGISAFYWLPALLELGHTNVTSQIGGGADFRDHFVCLQQLWDSPWGFGGSTAGCTDGLSFKIGKLHIFANLIALLFLCTFAIRKRFNHFNDTYHHRDAGMFIIVSLVGLVTSVLLMLEISKPIWEIISPMAFLQYPWRFLLLASFFSSFLAGVAVWQLRHINTVLYVSSVFVIIATLFLMNVKLFTPQTIMHKTSEDYTNEQHTKWITSKISDEYMPQGFKKPASEYDIVKERVSLGTVIEDKTNRLSFTTVDSSEQETTVRIAPFPAWQVLIDDSHIQYQETSDGLIVQIPRGSHTVTFSFVSTGIERLGNMLSIVSILVLLGGILGGKRVKRLAFFRA